MPEEMDFSEALRHIKNRSRMARNGWNGNGMWVILLDEKDYDVEAYARFNTQSLSPFIAIRTAGGSMVPWQPSIGDVLANDWYIV